MLLQFVERHKTQNIDKVAESLRGQFARVLGINT